MRIKNKLLALGCIAATAGSLVCGMACNEHEIEPFASSLVAGKKQLSSSGSARAVDILFVIDNSNSMSEEQLGLDKNFGKFIDRLTEANADYRIAVVTTSDAQSILAASKAFNTAANSAFFTFAKKSLQDAYNLKSDAAFDSFRSTLTSTCSAYFKDASYISSEAIDAKFKSGAFDTLLSATNLEFANDAEKKKEVLKNLFRCTAMAGISGDPIERGLSTMWKALSSNQDFKREGSILSVVFVTDENDCSDVYFDDNGSAVLARDNVTTPTASNIMSEKSTKDCENKRNIEDSCTITKRDAVTYSSENGTVLVAASGQPIEYNGEKKLLRDWCVQGDATARAALCSCLVQHEEYESAEVDENGNKVGNVQDCAAAANINFSAKSAGCTSSDSNHLVPRNYYYQKVIDFVIKSNSKFYRSQRAEFANMTVDEFKAEAEQLAKSDVIIANIINRDEGMRYDKSFPETWCGSAGNQSYRYQLFGEMFNNDPIYAPICCSNEEYKASKDLVDASETCTDNDGDEIACDIVCTSGANDAEKNMNGSPALFGPVLGAIGKRIGEAVNTLCAEAAPVTCKIEDCNEKLDNGNYSSTTPRSNPGPACPCIRGCNGDNVYLANSDREYTVCNEFRVSIGSAEVDTNADGEKYVVDGSYKAYDPDSYKIDYESNYCYIRTGSPIQINLSKNDGKELVIEFPKKTK